MPQPWFLCDFHIHTSFSDGSLALKEVVDLYGQHGFGVIGVSITLFRPDKPINTQKDFMLVEQTLVGETH